MHGLEVDFKQTMQATYYSKHEVYAKKILYIAQTHRPRC